MSYQVPEEFFFRIHHIRPRFKDDVENVLIYVASEISKLPELPEQEFKEKLNAAIYRYPGNLSKKEKTINNWRTEITSLFGLLQFNTDKETVRPGAMSRMLADNQDLVEFFKYFLFYFQYPGGHLKAHEIAQCIKAEVRFKPAKYILSVLQQGERLTGRPFGINRAEATHCIFNDLRVTREGRSPEETARLIIENRDRNTDYDWTGDVIRYAGDILDYLVIADLLETKPNNMFYLRRVNLEPITAFIQSPEWFGGYDPFYGQDSIEPPEIEKLREEWFDFVNRKLKTDVFETDVLKFLGEEQQATAEKIIHDFQQQLTAEERPRDKDIGDFGESLCHIHERNRLSRGGRANLRRLVVRVPTSLAMGFDIKSVEADQSPRFVEAKTTISRSKITVNSFHMTTNEWKAAESLDGSYYIYRVMISSDEIKLFVIRDPVSKYKDGKVDMVPRNGADISYNENSGREEELLL